MHSSYDVLNNLLAEKKEAGGNEAQERKEKMLMTGQLRLLFAEEEKKHIVTHDLYKKLTFQLSVRQSSSNAILRDMKDMEKKGSQKAAPDLYKSYADKIETCIQQEEGTYNLLSASIEERTALLARIKEQIDRLPPSHQDNSYIGLYPLREARLSSFTSQVKQQYLKEKKSVDEVCNRAQQKIDDKLKELEPVSKEPRPQAPFRAL